MRNLPLNTFVRVSLGVVWKWLVASASNSILFQKLPSLFEFNLIKSRRGGETKWSGVMEAKLVISLKLTNQCFSNVNVHVNHCQSPKNAPSDFVSLGRGLGVCISDRLLEDAIHGPHPSLSSRAICGSNSEFVFSILLFMCKPVRSGIQCKTIFKMPIED